MAKYLIFGNGWIGNKFKTFLENSEISSANITDSSQVWEALIKHNADIVINCAGKTGKPNVDWCEDHKFETMQSNIAGPVVLANACKKYGSYLVHLGSGCVYEGDNNGRGFSEEDPPNFFGSFYSITKMAAEQALKSFSDVLQLRIRMPAEQMPSERNFITKIVKYKKIISIPNSITVIEDFFPAAKTLMDKKATGIYNLVNPGPITHEEILDLYKKIVDPFFSYEIMSLDELYKITKAKRSNCILSTKKLEAEGIKMPEIYDSLEKCLGEYKKHHNREEHFVP